jgi:hypothetical protein
MTVVAVHKDLVVLTADKNAQFALRGIMSRGRAMRIRSIQVDFHVHPGRDPGVLRNAHEFLRAFARSHGHALVVLDREGCGQEQVSRDELETTIEGALRNTGWGDRGRAIVIDPELDIWVWSDSPHVPSELGWLESDPAVVAWLEEQGFAFAGRKPERPKEALEAVLRKVCRPRSSAIYQALAEKVGLSRCTDQAFDKLRTTLQAWFAEV